MQKEIEYTQKTDTRHLKAYGQYFTKESVAQFMCTWACQNAKTMLDPAAGNSIFLTTTRTLFPECSLTGFELDKKILSYFGNPADAELKNTDYLLYDWQTKYDAIVCNPPYNRFQAVPERRSIIKTIRDQTGISYSSYTNLYILFLIKSLHQLSACGRLAYIIPTEFLNSAYGSAIKQMLIKEKLLLAIINFKNDSEMFFNATTTCCLLLADHSPKKDILFYNLDSLDDLSKIDPRSIKGLPHNKTAPHPADKLCHAVDYNKIDPTEKWRKYLSPGKIQDYVNQPPDFNINPSSNFNTNLKPISHFCTISRSIATGANDYFCMSPSKAAKYAIPPKALKKCICRSADITHPVFTGDDFFHLAQKDKNVYILDIAGDTGSDSGMHMDPALESYIKLGESEGVNRKYLPSHRKPWYSMENNKIAPIWVTTACRKNLKFIRNLAGINTLTTFHSVYIKEEYQNETDIIFCYFLTPLAQEIIRENRKELGNGLEKYQPKDMMEARMLDITKIKPTDRSQILSIFQKMTEKSTFSGIDELTRIFSQYI